MAVTPLQLVTELYIAYFNRAPDPAGLNAWIADLNAGATITQVANAFANSGEAKALYPFLTISTIPDPASAAGFVSTVYGNLLNRAPDGTPADATTGWGFWTKQLDTGALTPGQFILAVLQSVNQQTGTPDAATIANKVTVADFYETTVATLNAQFSLAAATAAIAGVTNTTSVAAAEAAILASVARNTFTLTANTDIVTDLSGLGHDVVNAPLVIGILGAQTQSINVGDQITLSGDNNIANITLGSTIGSTSWPAGSVLNLGTGVANTFNVTNVGSILPIPGILPGLIPGNDIIGANIINDNNSVASVAILGVPGIIGTTGLMTVPTAINMSNTTTTGLFVQVDTTQLNGTQSVALGVTGVGIPKYPAGVQESAEGTLYGALSVGSNVPGTPGFGTFNMKIAGNNAVALGNNGSTGTNNLVVTGTGNLQLASVVTVGVGLGDTGAEFQKIKTIDTTGVTGNVSVSGAGGEIGGKAATELWAVNPFLASAGGGVVGAGNLALTSVKMGNGNNFLDISQGSLVNFAATGLTVAMGTGTNELVVDDTVASSAAPVTFYSGVTTLGIANAGATAPVAPAVVDTYNMANLGVNSLAFFGDAIVPGVTGTMVGAVAIINAQNNFSLDMGSADQAGFAVSIAGAAAISGTNATANVTIGVNDPLVDPTGGAGTGEFSNVGVLTSTNFGNLNINALGGAVAPAFAAANTFDFIAGISATDATVFTVNVNVAGNANLLVGAGLAAAPPVIDGVAGPAFALQEIGNGSFFTDTDTGAVELAGSVAVQSITATASGGLIMDSLDTSNIGTIGVAELGSATKVNFLAGSLGNDVIKLGAAGGSTVITEGGGDAITLAAHGPGGDIIDLYLGASAPSAAPNYTQWVAGSQVGLAGAGNVAQQGFWGIAPGGAAVNLSVAAAAAPGTGTAGDLSVVGGFNAATDAIQFSATGWLATGTYHGLVNANGVTIAAAQAQHFESILSGGTMGLAGDVGANITYLEGASFGSAGAMAQALQSQSFALFLPAAPVAGVSQDLLIGWQDTKGNEHYSDLNVTFLTAGTELGGANSNLIASDMVQLTGITQATMKAGPVGDILIHA